MDVDIKDWPLGVKIRKITKEYYRLTLDYPATDGYPDKVVDMVSKLLRSSIRATPEDDESSITPNA